MGALKMTCPVAYLLQNRPPEVGKVLSSRSNSCGSRKVMNECMVDCFILDDRKEVDSVIHSGCPVRKSVEYGTAASTPKSKAGRHQQLGGTQSPGDG
ncbi:hypothetical protein Ancab_019723 [Ancistrocladus abbreviatus]